MRAGLMRSTFSVENQRLEYLLQRFYSSIRFYNDSVFTEIFLNRIKQNRKVFARFGSMWTGPKWSKQCKHAHHLKQFKWWERNTLTAEWKAQSIAQNAEM
jgi:truncated hemoglobin YjbI